MSNHAPKTKHVLWGLGLLIFFVFGSGLALGLWIGG